MSLPPDLQEGFHLCELDLLNELSGCGLESQRFATQVQYWV